MDLQEFTDTCVQIRLFTESGRSLVSGTSVSALSYTTTPYMTANETYPGSISGITLNGATNDITADITTGKLGALIEMQIGRAQSELQSLMRISYAVFCLKKKKTTYKKQY